jgi:type I restriction enzyme M protein
VTSSRISLSDADIKSIVQRLWTFCSLLKDDGVSYSDYVEQLTYLLFLKMDDENATRSGIRSSLPKGNRWPDLVGKSGIDLEGQYLSMLQSLARQPGMVGRIFHRAQNRIQDAAKLRRLIQQIDAERWADMDGDVKGAIYEGLLERNSEDVKSGAGQYFTPRALLRAIVAVTEPQPGERICDPACGTGGFLLECHRWLATHHEGDDAGRYTGWEIVQATARLCLMNLYLRGIPDQLTDIHVGDALVRATADRFDLVLSNPPFGRRSSMTFTNAVRGDPDQLLYERPDFVATTSNKQLNFLQHIMSMLGPDGRAAVILPDNTLSEAGAAEVIRRSLLRNFDVHTMLRLPAGIFYAGSVQATVIFFERLQQPMPGRRIWTYDLRSGTRFSLRSKPLDDDALADFVRSYGGASRRGRRESERFSAEEVDVILASDRCSLNLGMAKKASPDVPDQPEAIVAEILDDLGAALEAIRSVEEQLSI